MNETTWAQDPSEKPVKKSMPKWVWFCGGGCLLALIVGVVSLIVIGNYLKNAVDPVRTEAALQLVVPHDPLPATLEFGFYNSIGMEQFILQDNVRGFQVQLQVHEGGTAEQAHKDMFGGDTPKIPADMGVMKFEDMKKAEIDIQGRILSVIRLKLEFSGLMSKWMPEEAKDQMGSMLWTDLATEGSGKFILLQVIRTHGKGEITDDELRDLLQPFHIGPNR